MSHDFCLVSLYIIYSFFTRQSHTYLSLHTRFCEFLFVIVVFIYHGYAVFRINFCTIFCNTHLVREYMITLFLRIITFSSCLRSSAFHYELRHFSKQGQIIIT